MWPFDLLRRLFGRAESDDPVADKLAEFVKGEEGQRSAHPDREKTGSREMIATAQRTVRTICDAYERALQERVRRFGKDFRVYKPADQQTRDIDLKFGDTKTGNEYRYVALAFKDRYAIVLRVQAVILSRDILIQTAFFEFKSENPAKVQELDLSAFDSLEKVAWDKVVDRVVLEFLEWQKSARA